MAKSKPTHLRHSIQEHSTQKQPTQKQPTQKQPTQKQLNQAPSLIKLGACLLYESLTWIAILFVSAAVFIWLFGDASHGLKRLALQMFLWIVLGAYYLWCWVKSGQTLAMQAWNIKLVTTQNGLPDLSLAIMRYVLATFSFACLGLGFLWAIFDRQGLFLHDRLLNTKLVLSLVDVTQHSQPGK